MLNTNTMRTINKSTLILALSVGMFACKSIKKTGEKLNEKAEYSAEPKYLEVHGDSVVYETKITIPAKTFYKKAVLKVDPILTSTGNTMSRPPLTIGGGKTRSGTDYTIDPKDGGTVTYTDKFAYDPTYDQSTLIAKNSLVFEAKFEEQDQCLPIEDKVIANGIIATSTRANSSEDNIYFKTPNVVAPEKKISSSIYYLVNSTSFSPTFTVTSAGVSNKVELSEIAKMLKNDTFGLKGLTVNSYASPDGPTANNERLAKGRANTTNNYLKKELKKLGIKEVNDTNFYHSYSFTENWQGWKEEVMKSDLSDKNEILNIMNSNMSDDDKEMKIKREHAASYDKMRTTILPRLRKSEVIFGSAASILTDVEVMTVGKQSLDNLNKQDVLRYGKLSNDLDEKRRVYTYYVSKNPNDWEGFNNIAAVNLKTGEWDDAKTNLDKANSISPNNAYVLNNLGVYYKAKKDYDMALKNLQQAKNINDPEIKTNYNLGTVYLKKGKYTEAIESYGNADKCHYNVGLAYLLNKDYDNAQSSLDCIATKDADTYYLLGVLSARKGNLDGVISNLKTAFQTKPELKKTAKYDAEFRDFKSKSEFEAIIR